MRWLERDWFFNRDRSSWSFVEESSSEHVIHPVCRFAFMAIWMTFNGDGGSAI
jgi:hypothetical protein